MDKFADSFACLVSHHSSSPCSWTATATLHRARAQRDWKHAIKNKSNKSNWCWISMQSLAQIHMVLYLQLQTHYLSQCNFDQTDRLEEVVGPKKEKKFNKKKRTMRSYWQIIPMKEQTKTETKVWALARLKTCILSWATFNWKHIF